MVEQNSFSDALATIAQPHANAEHEKTLQALQSEIEYHRKYDLNGSYMQQAVAYVSDGDASSLQKLELTYQKEKDNPNSVSREEVIQAVLDDQKAMRWQDSKSGTLVSSASTMLAVLGGRYGRIAAAGVTALETMHPNDSLDNQVLEGAMGFGLGMGAGKLYQRSMGMSNQWIGVPLAVAAYPMAQGVARDKWPHQGIGEKPNPVDIFNTEIPSRAQTPYSNLRFQPNPEWSQFDMFLKK